MTLNLTFCPNLKLGTLCSCRERPDTESPETVSSSDEEETRENISLVDTDIIQFDQLIPSHEDYLFMKILDNMKIVSVSGNLLSDFHLRHEDLEGFQLNEVHKKQELFIDFVHPLVERAFANKTAYQFCFKMGSNDRTNCCSIYPCSIPGRVSSVDCVVRPAALGIRASQFDRFEIPKQDVTQI